MLVPNLFFMVKLFSLTSVSPSSSNPAGQLEEIFQLVSVPVADILLCR